MQGADYLSFLSDGISKNGREIFFNYKLKEEEIKPYLKNPEKIPSTQDLNINAFIPGKINEFEQVFKNKVERVAAKILPLYLTKEDDKATQILLDNTQKIFSEACVELRWKKFCEGKSFEEISQFEIDPNFIVAEIINKEVNESSSKQTDTVRRLRSRYFQKKWIPCPAENQVAIRDLPNQSLSVVAQVFNEMLFLRENDSSNEITWAELSEKVVLILDQADNENKELINKTNKKASLSFDKFLKEEKRRLQSQPIKPKPPKKQSFTKPKKKDEAKADESQKPKPVPIRILSPLEKDIMKLNSSSLTLGFNLAPRVGRWDTSDLSKIREFEDGGEKKYENCSDEELLKFRNDHRLNGIERVLSIPKLMQTFSEPYEHTNKKGEKQHGRRFDVTKVVGSISEEGSIFVGTDENGIVYHAMYEKTKKGKKPSLENQAEMLQAYKDSKNSQVGEKWEQISLCTFSSDNGSIEMTIGKEKEGQVTFYLYPQKRQA